MTINAERISDGIERVRERLYADQPDTMSAFVDLLDLLQVAFCEHEFVTTRNPDTPDGPSEMVTVCKKCGVEPDD
jgi:hypothetical protein